MMMLGINGLPLTNPSTRNHFFLLHDALNMVRIIFWIVCLNLTITSSKALVITGLPLPIPSDRNYFFLRYGVFYRARIMFGIAGLPVAIPSTMHHPQITLKRPGSCWVLLGFLRLFHSPGIVLSMAPRPCWLLLASILLFYPAGIISFSFCLSSQHGQSHWVLLASLRLFHQPGIFSLSYMVYSMGSGRYLVTLISFLIFHPPGIISFFYMDNSLSSIHQASSFLLTIFYNCFLNWRLICYPFHWILDKSLNTALFF